MEDFFEKRRKKLKEDIEDIGEEEDSDLPIHEKYTKGKKFKKS